MGWTTTAAPAAGGSDLAMIIGIVVGSVLLLLLILFVLWRRRRSESDGGDAGFFGSLPFMFRFGARPVLAGDMHPDRVNRAFVGPTLSDANFGRADPDAEVEAAIMRELNDMLPQEAVKPAASVSVPAASPPASDAADLEEQMRRDLQGML
jgi:hypothetical protein